MGSLRRWIITGAAVFALGSACWPGSAAAQSTKPPVRHAHVYLLRGLINVFSLGMDELAAKIVQRGVYATVHNHMAWPMLASEAAADYRAGREGPIIIIGHSLGGDAALKMADELAQEGVPVKLVVTFDPVSSLIVEGNVGKVVNLYISNGWGAPVARGPKFRGTLVNVDLRDRPDVGHIFIDKSAALHQQVLGYVMQAVTHNAAPSPALNRVRGAAPGEHANAPPGSGSAQDPPAVTAAPKTAAENQAAAPVVPQAK
jgi:pimeloyl-ACP methyl ester carboxylesterase